MFIRIHHERTWRFDPAARGVLRSCRLNPRNFDGQHVMNWRMDVNVDCHMKFSEDGFGNLVQSFSVDGPVTELGVAIECSVDTFDTHGVVRGAVERFPPELYLRPTALTQASNDLRVFARDVCAGIDEPFAKAHALLPSICNAIAWDRTTAASDVLATRGAADVFKAKTGDSREIAHVFLACARLLKIPTRFVSGFCMPAGGEEDWPGSSHCWAEAWCEGYGWIGFDAAIGVCARETHVRLACALDWLGAAPYRTGQSGFSTELIGESTTMTTA